MSNILVTHAYFLRFDPKQWALSQPYAPLGTLYAAALLRQASLSVTVFDTMFASSPDEISPMLDRYHPDIVVLCDDGFNYLTKMCLTNMREAAFEMIRHSKAMDCKVIVSSSDATDHVDLYIDKGADFIVIGEVEASLLELVQNIRSEVNDFAHVKGIAYLSNGGLLKTGKRELIRDLDSLPFPARDLIDMEPYRRAWIKSKGYFSINMATTRGCPFKCNWCAKPIYGNRYNHRSPENVTEELALVKQTYQVDHVWFCDDIFGLKPGWVGRFSELLNTAQIRIRFKIQARADLLLHDQVLAELGAAGCETIWMGAESGSQKILDAMDKEITVKQIYEVTHRIRENGMNPAFFIQFGYPGETREDINQTIGMINDLLPYEIGISVSYPLPGTKFYERVKSELTKKANWTDSDEMALMFRNTYSAAFYKQLHRYVHKTYRKHLAMRSLRQLFTALPDFQASNLRRALMGIYYLPASLLERQKLNRLEKSIR